MYACESLALLPEQVMVLHFGPTVSNKNIAVYYYNTKYDR
jgi:hypothetical protein